MSLKISANDIFCSLADSFRGCWGIIGDVYEKYMEGIRKLWETDLNILFNSPIHVIHINFPYHSIKPNYRLGIGGL